MPGLSERDRALMRSQSGSGVAFSTTPCTPLTRQLFRVPCFVAFVFPSFSRRFCRCGRLFDALGHHRAVCARAGVLGRCGFALESAAARICREAGGRLTTNIFLRDLDITVPNARDSRRLEVVAEGLPLWKRSTGNGVPSSWKWIPVMRRKKRTYPELTAPRSRARLVVVAMEVGGRWSPEALTFIRLLARAKARHEPNLMRKFVEQALRMRWCSFLGCAAARALATSLLELRGSGGADGDVPPSHEVEGRHSGLSEGGLVQLFVWWTERENLSHVLKKCQAFIQRSRP